MLVNFFKAVTCDVITASKSKRTMKKFTTDVQSPVRMLQGNLRMYICDTRDITVYSYTLKILLIHVKKLIRG